MARPRANLSRAFRKRVDVRGTQGELKLASSPHRAGGWFLGTLATNIALAALGVATGVLAARLLGPEGRGELAAIQLLPMLLSGLAMLGLGEAVTYFSARDPSRASVTITTALLTALASAMAFVVVGQFLVAEVLADYSEAVRSAAAIYLFYIVLHAIAGIPHQAFRGLGDFPIWNAIRCTPGFIWLVVLLGAYFAGPSRADSLALQYLAGTLALGVLILLTVRIRIPGPLRFDPASGRSLLAFGFPTVIGVVPQILSSRLDQVVVAAVLPVGALGNYAVAVAWGGIAHPLVGAIGAVVLPTIARRTAVEGRRRALCLAARTSVLVILVLALVMVPLTPAIVPWLFGASFATAVPAAELLIIASSLVALNSVIVEGFRGYGLPIAAMRSDLAGAVTAVAAGLTLVEPYGLLGAACTALAAASVATVVLLVQAQRMLGIAPWELLVPRLSESRMLLRRGVEAVGQALRR